MIGQMSIFDYMDNKKFYYSNGSEILIGDTIWACINGKPKSNHLISIEHRKGSHYVAITEDGPFTDMRFVCKSSQEVKTRSKGKISFYSIMDELSVFEKDELIDLTSLGFQEAKKLLGMKL